MASVEAGPSVVTGNVTSNLTPAGGNASPSSARSYSQNHTASDVSVSPDAGAYGRTVVLNTNSVTQALTLTFKFKMRAVDQGAVAPGYVYWVAQTVGDFAGVGYSGASPTPIGAMLAGSAQIVDFWIVTSQ